MNNTKSPFLVYQDFVSPKVCDQICNNVLTGPVDTDPQGYPSKMEGTSDEFQSIIYSKLTEIIPQIEKHYGIEYDGTEEMVFQRFDEGMQGLGEDPKCHNSLYLRKKWVQVNSIDLTCVLWCKDYQDTTPIDVETEVYGGKLEFPAYDFSLQPQKGTLIIYPAGPHFISAVSPVLVGDLKQVRINISGKGNFIYQPDQFPGTYTEWFRSFV